MHTRRVVLPLILVFSALRIFAQQTSVPTGTVDPAALEKISPRLISFTDTIDGQPDGALTVTFGIYDDQQATTALWTETQIVQITNGKYTALLGATSADGLPETIFAADQAHWLAVQANGTEQRHLLVAVPYAIKALEAERFGGLLPSQYVTVAELQTILQNSATPASGSGSGSKTTSPSLTQAASGSTTQPATDFTDNNDTEVLLVTQQGTGYAIHAISAGDAALFGENSSATGTALKALASASTGNTIAILGQAASSGGIAGVFDSLGGGEILSLRSSGTEVAGVDNFGNIKAAQITAQNFVGNGYGLTNIGPNAVNAQSGNFPDAIVIRDGTGSFAAGQITAQNFVGNGYGLTNIGPNAVNAQSGNFPGAIVLRDPNGDFAAGQISANNFVGNGYGLTNIGPNAINAQAGNFPGAVVIRDPNGDFAAGQISANNFVGNGFGLTNIGPNAINAQAGNFPGAVVIRDPNGDFAAGQISANNFVGNGFGLTNIGPNAINAQSGNFPSAVVVRDTSGNFAASQISATGLIVSGSADFSAASTTAPVKAVLSANTPATCQASKELLIKTDAPAGQQLFICNATGDGYVLVGDGTAAGVIGVTAADSSVTIGGTSQLPSISVANGGITSAKLAPDAISSANIADGSLTAAKIAGTAATLGANTFSGNQIVQGSLAAASVGTGPISAISATFSGGGESDNQVSIKQTGASATLVVTANGLTSTAAINAQSIEGDAIDARATYNYAVNASSTNGIGVLANGGNVGMDSSGNNFGVRASGATALVGNGTNFGISANASAASGVAVSMTTGSAGKFLSGSSSAGQPYFTEVFNVDTFGDIFSAGSVSAPFPNDIFGTRDNRLARPDGTGGVQHSLATDTSGIIGVVISGEGSTGNAQVAYSGVAGCLFDSATVAGDYVVNSSKLDGYCSDGGSAFPASGQVVGRVLRSSATSAVVPILLFGSEVRGLAGALSFSQITGTASAAQLPAAVVYNNQSNTFTGSQTINGGLTVLSTATVLGTVGAQSFSGDGAGVFNVNAAKLQGSTLGDLASSSELSLETSNRQAADATLQNNIDAETNSRITNDGNLQGSINTEISNRIAGENALQNNVNTESSLRAAGDTNLQTNIDNVSAADAKLAASNTFTAGTQDFSGAAATLPVRAVLTGNTPATCVAGKELLIKTDAPAGQQLFICDASGTTWNLVGDGASGGVTSFNGRAGTVTPAANDYSFAQISGSVAAAQLPGLTGDVTSPAGSTSTTLAPTGIPSGVYTKITIDTKGRAIAGNQAAFSDLSGSAIAAQLPSNVVYNDQVNVFSAGQIVNGTLSATSLSGSGAGVTNVNAASLSGLPASSFAQINTANAFTAKQTMSAPALASASLNLPAGPTPTSPIAGDVWNSGSTIQYRDNGSNTRTLVSTMQSGGTLLLKLTASITPASVGAQSCTEQSFTVSGIAGADMLLSVAQPSTSSPGTNIAIGGWRVSAGNTVAIQFCNPSRSNSTPAAGTYTFAIWR